VLVTVVAPGGLRADLAVPGDVPVAELLDRLRAALPGLPPAPATLAPLGGEALPPASSLTACGIGDGAVLALAAGWPDDRTPARPPSPVASGWPDRPPATATPGPLPLSARLCVAVRALLGGTRPGTAGMGAADPGAGPGPRWSPASALHAWRDSSYERRLRAAVAAAPLARCVRVAVVGATPRAGATTVAALLAAVLAAERPGRTVAVDASPGPGSLTELLAPCHDLFADELVGLLDHPMLTRRELAAVLARRGHLGVLAARPGPPAGARVGRVHPEQVEQPDLAGRGWARVLQALGRHATTVVVDCGPGAATPAAPAALAAADQVVLVSDPWLSPAATAAGLLAERGQPPLLLVNRAPGDLAAAELVARVPGASGAVLLPADPAAAAAVAAPPPPGAPGAPLDLARLSPLWRRRADELAMLLAAEWPSLAPEAG
jgi:hypothetical protein